MPDYTYTDPRKLDGTPFEVARAAIQQTDAAVKLALRALDDAEVMARNAEMERNLLVGADAAAELWGGGAYCRQFVMIRDALGMVVRRLAALKAAVSYDPKHPPTA